MGVGTWLFIRQTTAISHTATAPTPANVGKSKPTTQVAQVEMPKLPPATPRDTAAPATDNAPPGQRAEIAADIKDMITRLKAGDTAGVLLDYGNLPIGRRPATQASVMRSFDKHRFDMLTLLESLQTATPLYTLNPGGDADFYIYDIIDPVTLKSDTFNVYKRKSDSGWAFDLAIVSKWNSEAGPAGQP